MLNILLCKIIKYNIIICHIWKEQVSRIYKDQSIGNPVSIAVMKIVETDKVFGSKYTGSDGIAAAEMLKRFCQWQKENNPDEPSAEHHDAALLLTRFIYLIPFYIFQFLSKVIVY